MDRVEEVETVLDGKMNTNAQENVNIGIQYAKAL